MKNITHGLFGAPEAWGPRAPGPSPASPLDKTALPARALK